jgi:hypothetical protein
MSNLSSAGSVGRRVECVTSDKSQGVRQKPRLVLITVTLTFVCLITSIASTIATARTGVVPLHIDLPHGYLPGSPLPLLPRDAECSQISSFYVSCHVQLIGEEVYLTYELGTKMVVHTAIRVREYTAGDLIVAWGIPTGITQSGSLTYLNWGNRSASVYTSSFGPGSRVKSIIYSFAQQQALPWRGFTNIRD